MFRFNRGRLNQQETIEPARSFYKIIHLFAADSVNNLLVTSNPFSFLLRSWYFLPYFYISLRLYARYLIDAFGSVSIARIYSEWGLGLQRYCLTESFYIQYSQSRQNGTRH